MIDNSLILYRYYSFQLIIFLTFVWLTLSLYHCDLKQII